MRLGAGITTNYKIVMIGRPNYSPKYIAQLVLNNKTMLNKIVKKPQIHKTKNVSNKMNEHDLNDSLFFQNHSPRGKFNDAYLQWN